MPQPLAQLPKSVRDHARFVRLGPAGVPSLVAHPDWHAPAPFCLWMHGRTATKELDPGRYSRWLRAGIGVCAIDLPGHGERANPPRQEPVHTLAVIEQAVSEIDGVVGDLGSPRFAGVFDADRAAIGGMSMGGMVALRRLCEPHRFRCAAVESTSGNLKDLYFPPAGDGAEPWPVDHDPREVAGIDPMEHLSGFDPVPLLVLHSESDQMVPWVVQQRFITRLREHFRGLAVSADGGGDHAPDLIEVHTWPSTGAPAEHIGFGRMSDEAKGLQVAFLGRYLLGREH